MRIIWQEKILLARLDLLAWLRSNTERFFEGENSYFIRQIFDLNLHNEKKNTQEIEAYQKIHMILVACMDKFQPSWSGVHLDSSDDIHVKSA
jgi:hypothetical protein